MAMKGGNPKNLTPYKKGHKSTGGRPKGSISLTKTLEKMLEEEHKMRNPFSRKNDKKTFREWLNLSLVAKGIKGSVPALQMIYERMDGKVKQGLEIEGTLDVKNMTTEELEDFINDKNKK